MKIKNIITGLLLVGVIGLLALGALNRTLSKTDNNISLFNLEKTRSWLAQNNETTSTTDHGTIAEQGQGQGSGRWQTNETTSTSIFGNAADQGQGLGSNRRDQEPGNAKTNNEEFPASQADIQEWIAVKGAVTEMDPSYLVITTDDGTLIEVGGRPWSYIQSQGFFLESGSSVALQGFYETEDRFEIGALTNLSTGKNITIRDQTGRPMWAGGRGGGQNLDG